MIAGNPVKAGLSREKWHRKPNAMLVLMPFQSHNNMNHLLSILACEIFVKHYTTTLSSIAGIRLAVAPPRGSEIHGLCAFRLFVVLFRATRHSRGTEKSPRYKTPRQFSRTLYAIAEKMRSGRKKCMPSQHTFLLIIDF